MKCESCEAKVESAPMAQFWSEIHVGGVPSSVKFYLCPDCSDDSEVHPLDFVEYRELSA